MEVMARANLPNNPYKQGETAPRNHELYCEWVIANQQPLLVNDADTDADWRGNPDTKLGMISYYGVPVNWPSGDCFGTFCILDRHPKTPTSNEKRFVERFARVVEDHLRLIELSANYEYLASHDPLTGIFNRRTFDEVARQQISAAQRSGTSMALVAFDLDHFKAVNDELGHAAGDKVLQSVSDAVTANLRQSDFFARTGGEEFVILGTVENANGLLAMGERIRSAVENAQINHASATGPVTISCGISVLHADDNLEALMKRADDAMYQAKSAGRNCCKVIR